MNEKELEVVGDLDSSQMSEQLSMGIDSSSVLQKQRRLKKLRSIRLSKSPSLKKPSRRRSNSNYHASCDASCSCASADNLQNSLSARNLTRRPSFKPAKNLTRISSIKFKSPLMRKYSGGTQMNNLKNSRVAKPANSETSRTSARPKKSGFVGASSISSGDADSSSPKFSKETCCSNERKTQFQASPRNSESSYCSGSETGKRSVYSKPNSQTSPGQMSPFNVSTKFAKPKSKKSSMMEHSEISQISDLSVERATCSSALRGSKVPDIQGLQAEGPESEGIVGKVCPFTYCSLHGHRHASVPPLKRLISIRRRMLKTQRGMAPATQPLHRVKKSGKIREDRTKQMVCNGQGAVHDTTSPMVEKLGRELFSDIHAEPETDPSGIGTYSENGEDNNNFSKISESHIHLEESLHTVERHVLVSLPVIGDLNPVCCCIGTGLEATDTGRTEEKIPASSIQNEGAPSSCTDNLRNSDPTLVGKIIEVDECVTVKPTDELETTPDEVAESTRDNKGNKLASVASDCEILEEQTAANEKENGSVEPESKPNRTTDVAYSVQEKDRKYIRMWQLMYKHAVKGTTENVENQLPLDGVYKEEQAEGTNGVLETINLGSFETDEHTGLTNHSAGDQTTELCQHDAIKLVQEAFDNILLPEVQDPSYDDQSFSSGISSDQEALEQGQDEGGEQNTSTFSHSFAYRMAQNPEARPKEGRTVSKVGDKTYQKTPKSWSSLKKFILLKRFVKAVEKVRNLKYREPQYPPLDNDPEAEKVNLRQQKTEERKKAEEWMLDYALQQVISKLPPAQQRRVALLVEAFETVLPFPEIKTSHRSTAIDSSEADLQVCNGLSVPSANHSGKERDSGTSAETLLGNMSCSEICFNEYPAQVGDVQMEDQKSAVNFSKLKDSSIDQGGITKELGISASVATTEDQKEKQIVRVKAGDGDDGDGTVIVVYDKTDLTNISFSESKDEQGNTSCEGLVQEIVQEAPKETISTTLEISNMIYKEENIKLETNKLIMEVGDHLDSSEDQKPESHVDLTADNMEPTEEPVAAMEEVNGGATPESGFVRGFPRLEKSHSESNTDLPHETQLEKQKYTNLWFLVYKHMVSSVDAKDGEEPLNAVGEEQVDEADRFDLRDQEMSTKNHYADNRNIELRHIEAIKLQVEKAIDEIILPENQEEPDDDKSSTGALIPDQDPPENKVDVEERSFISTSISFATSDNATIQEEEKTAAKVEEKPKKTMSKNWSNLKKMILLNRFIKALENVKKFNPRGPRDLPLDPDPEAEKVHLKSQSMGERKNSEEWMLDYALQQAVARLTPARKRKVSLLVEAFETVIPNNGIPNPFKPQITH